tara:strand:- start:554 stop:760 length:207 start_codon:yes stop_codon:yes gene_type:complete
MTALKNKMYREPPKITAGDILEDRHGNKMVVIDVVPESVGDCYVLLNGRIKLVNPSSSFIIKSHKKNI